MTLFNFSNRSKSNFPIRMIDVLDAAAIFFALTAAAYAVDTPMGGVVCDIVAFVYGNLGRGIAVLAICVVGVGAMLGKASWGLAIMVGVGIGVLFGSMPIASYIYSGGTTASLNMCA